MTDNYESDIKYIPYKEVVKKRALEYYYANKEAMSEKRKEKYKQLPPEEKKKLLEYNKQWFNSQSQLDNFQTQINTCPSASNRTSVTALSCLRFSHVFCISFEAEPTA